MAANADIAFALPADATLGNQHANQSIVEAGANLEIAGRRRKQEALDCVRSRTDSTRKVLNAIQQTDWETIYQRIKDAISGDQLGELDVLLYQTALRHLPLPAKSMLDIARHYPRELDNPAFQKVHAGTIPGQTATTDPVFNPAALLASYYRTRSAEANAAHAEGTNQSGRLREPDPRSEPTGDDPDLRAWNDVSSKWMLTYDLKAAIEASLEKTKLLSDAIAAYERSRLNG